MVLINKEADKKALLSLYLSPKSSFTISKLRFLTPCKPKNSSFYSILRQERVPRFPFGAPSCYFIFSSKLITNNLYNLIVCLNYQHSFCIGKSYFDSPLYRRGVGGEDFFTHHIVNRNICYLFRAFDI